MAILRDDRRSLTRRGAGPRRVRFAFFALALVSLGLLVLSRLDHSGMREARWRLAEAMAPLVETGAGAVEPVRAAARRIATLLADAGDIERLKAENRRLEAEARRVAELERRLADLEVVTRTVVSPATGQVTARVVATSGGAFAQSLMISAGRDHGVRAGFPVMVAEGLVGRVTEVGRAVSRVLLLTDQTSRIPVKVGAARRHAVLAGDSGAGARLEFLPAGVTAAVGDVVETSGVGGLFPAGLRIGRVASTAGGALGVMPFARLDDVEHVNVLLHESPMQELVGAPPRSAADAGRLAPRAGGEPEAERR